MNKQCPYVFFRHTDTGGDFEPRGDGAPGISIKILGNTLDTLNKRGCQTRLLRLDPGTITPEAHAHDYWEEIYMLEGEMTLTDGTDGKKTVGPNWYAARKPSVIHGPVSSETG